MPYLFRPDRKFTTTITDNRLNSCVHFGVRISAIFSGWRGGEMSEEFSQLNEHPFEKRNDPAELIDRRRPPGVDHRINDRGGCRSQGHYMHLYRIKKKNAKDDRVDDRI